MSMRNLLLERLRSVIKPTLNQALGTLAAALAILLVAQSHALLSHLGISSAAINASQNQLSARFDVILRSSAASHLALVTFWATIGLIAYLICWSVYNFIIEARNKVTLATEYTNRGELGHLYELVALKAVAAAGLAGILSSLWYGVSFWIALAARVLAHTDPPAVTGAVVAWAGLAVQFYLVLVFIQLTFTPWYRPQAFTDH